MPRLPLTPRVADILSARVRELVISQKAIAEGSGISQSQVSKLLRGVRVINVDQLDALCSVLGLSIVDVVRQAVSSESRR